MFVNRNFNNLQGDNMTKEEQIDMFCDGNCSKDKPFCKDCPKWKEQE